MVALAIRKNWILFLALSLTWWMTQDKWLPHICQVSESKCEAHIFPQAVPSQPKLPTHLQHSHDLWCLMIPYTSYSLAATSQHASLLCLGCRTPKQKGRFSPTSQFYQKHLLQLSLHELKSDLSREALFLELMDYHQQCTLSLHLHTSHRDVGSQEVHFQLWNSIFPSATSLTWKILWHKDNIFISHGLHRAKRLLLSQGHQMLLYLHDYRFIFPPSRPFLPPQNHLCNHSSTSLVIPFPWAGTDYCWRTFEKYFTVMGLYIF